MSRPGIEDGLVLDLGAFELAGKRVARWLRASGRIRHEDLLESGGGCTGCVVSRGKVGVCHAARNDGRDRDRRQSGQPLLNLLVLR